MPTRIAIGGPLAEAEWRDVDKLTGAPIPYRANHNFEGSWLTTRHREIAEAPCDILGFLINLGIDGYLHKGEALKLYEMAYCGRGDILELGTHKGLSTSILAGGLHDRGGPGRLETVDIDELTSPIARANLAGQPGEDRVTFTLQDATDRLGGLIAERRQYGFVFVDHWHGYDATYEAAVRLPKLLPPGAYVMFHDFFDPGNSDPNHVYGVHQAVVTAFGADPSFVFVGGVGGSAILQRR